MQATNAFSIRNGTDNPLTVMTAPPFCWARKVTMQESALRTKNGIFSSTNRGISFAAEESWASDNLPSGQ